MKNVLAPALSLAGLHPEVAESWDSEKNGTLSPFDVRPKSNKKVWWRCGDGHSWQAVIAARTNGSGCPYCAGRKPTPQRNLLSIFPQIAMEWHPTRNASVKPNEVTPKSNRLVWWRCSDGHEWCSKVSNRTMLGQGCPFCSGNRPTQGRNFAAINPGLLREWHWSRNASINPVNLSPKSHRKVWWICQYGHEWTATLAARATGTGCPYCAPQTSRLELRLYAELYALLDQVEWRGKVDGLEVDLYLPAEKIAIEIDGYPWHRNAESRDRRKARTLANNRIRLLRLRDSRLPLVEASDLQYGPNESHLPIVERIFSAMLPFLSDDVAQRVRSHISSAEYGNEQFYQELLSYLPGPGPKCSLAHLRPDIAKDWHPTRNGALSSTMFSAASGYVAWWQCERRHAWKAAINNRTTRNTGCPFCSGRAATAENNLGNGNTILTDEWDNEKNGAVTPSDVTPKSNRKVWWRCGRGHSYQSSIKNRANGRGCPYCAHKLPLPEYNLSALFPSLALEWSTEMNNGQGPEDFLPQSNKRVWWCCDAGHAWKASPENS